MVGYIFNPVLPPPGLGIALGLPLGMACLLIPSISSSSSSMSMSNGFFFIAAPPPMATDMPFGFCGSGCMVLLAGALLDAEEEGTKVIPLGCRAVFVMLAMVGASYCLLELGAAKRSLRFCRTSRLCCLNDVGVA